MPNPNPLAGTQHTIHGTPAADTIVFTAAHTTVNAGEGANTITGTSGHNLINSGAGVDTIAVTSGDNTIQAGAGANTITATTGDNAITTGDGADTITVTSGDNTILAGDGANTIVATSGVNTITTGSGADTITTGGVAGGGNTINAGDGANTITTGAGDDTITGGNVVDAGDGANTVTTGAGNDTVYSGVDTDTITTGAGDDEIHIQGGTDTIAAGAGNDTLIADFSSATGAVSINTLAGTAAAGYAGNISGLGIATFAGVENFEITSGSFNDVVTTGDGTDVVHAGAGSDTVNLAGGNDEAIYTMAANTGASDVYQGGSGVDTLTLELTTAEWQSAAVQTDIANYQIFQAAHTNLGSGEADSDVFEFSAFDLDASEFEALSVVVDGVELDPNDQVIPDEPVFPEAPDPSGVTILTNVSVLGSWGATSGWQTKTFTVDTDGTYQISFGAANWHDSVLDGNLWIDNLEAGGDHFDFETGLGGFTSTGNVATTSATSTEGNSSAVLHTGESSEGVIESFLDYDVPNETSYGSAMTTSVDLEAGDTVSFDWRFDTSDYMPYNDYAFYSFELA
jgi:Ca2+-binding RTX toxin-like protein